MANVAYRNVTSGTGGVISAPSGIQNGDIMVVLVSGVTSVTIASGWTQLNTELSWALYTKIAWRIRQLGDTTYSFANCDYWMIGAWSSGDQTTPIVTSNFSSFSSVSNISLASLSASSIAGDAAAYIIQGAGYENFTPASNYTERGDDGQSQTIGDRLGLTASQSTSGTVVATGAETGVVLHIILRSSNTGIVWYDHEGVAPFSSIWRASRV